MSSCEAELWPLLQEARDRSMTQDNAKVGNTIFILDFSSFVFYRRPAVGLQLGCFLIIFQRSTQERLG